MKIPELPKSKAEWLEQIVVDADLQDVLLPLSLLSEERLLPVFVSYQDLKVPLKLLR
jgi:hypothetical protein